MHGCDSTLTRTYLSAFQLRLVQLFEEAELFLKAHPAPSHLRAVRSLIRLPSSMCFVGVTLRNLSCQFIDCGRRSSPRSISRAPPSRCREIAQRSDKHQVTCIHPTLREHAKRSLRLITITLHAASRVDSLGRRRKPGNFIHGIPLSVFWKPSRRLG